MKKLSMFFVALISLSVVFTSCENDEPKLADINVKVVGGSKFNDEITHVRAYAYDNEELLLVGEAKYQNGGFNMKLNAVTSDKLLSFDEEDFSETITISDKTAKFTSIQHFSAIKDNKWVGMFICTYADLSTDNHLDAHKRTTVMYFYADKDVNISGTEVINENFSIKYDVSLKIGWNMVIATNSENSRSYTSVKKIPSGYKWFYISYGGLN